MFLDDPNLDINTAERKQAKMVYWFCILGSLLPPLNFALIYIYNKQKIAAFAQRHCIVALNIQLFICLLLVVLLITLLYIGVFYALLLALAIAIYQLIFVIKGFQYAHQGEYYNAFTVFRFFTL